MTMRSQRPALASLLAWIAVLCLVLGTLPMASQPLADMAPSLLHLPAEQGDGEDALHRQAPAKLRRVLIQAEPGGATQPPANTTAALAFMPAALDFASAPITAPMAPRGYETDHRVAHEDTPGRRQQRGQAPPLA